MSRARERREAALLKRQVPEQDDDSEQFEWMDGEQPDDMYAGEDLEGDGQ